MNGACNKGVIALIAFCALSGIGGVVIAGLLIYIRATP
ncbi:Uncharacterised protein [Leminorella richardii]|uniref:Uncharacterized protein n=1 Tax=Leminorella richardii TaxID=158841 RepID=A0A2X4VDV9_9GAMM|nr:hypothetical protein [Leminorella richardii]SQI43460.1 Uncharacterised protein [Leminorella richardii]